MLKLVLFAVMTFVVCSFHGVEAEYQGSRAGMDVYCHADDGYTVGQHCFGLVAE